MKQIMRAMKEIMEMFSSCGFWGYVFMISVGAILVLSIAWTVVFWPF